MQGSPSKKDFDLSHGFLPKEDPLTQLPKTFSAWEETALTLPKLLLSQHFNQLIEGLPEFPVSKLANEQEYERAMLILSFIGHAYIWNNTDQIPARLPENIAQPWYKVAKKLGRPPVLSYESYALYNWKRLDPKKSVELGNIALLQNFHGGIDEEWFILIHIDIEAKAIPALNAIIPAQQAILDNDPQKLIQELQTIADSLEKICQTLDRMPEHCDPYIYYNRVRPYIHGWKDNPALPNGLIYEGVSVYHDKPQKFKGETGAQSSIIPALDATLKIQHRETPLTIHLEEMFDYMPPQHRHFVKTILKAPSIRDFVIEHKTNTQLKKIYNHCIELIGRFRSTHLHYAAQYIQKQSQNSAANPTEIGTGGTPFMKYLRKHKEETEQHVIP